MKVFSNLAKSFKWDRRFRHIFITSLMTWTFIILLSLTWFNYVDTIDDPLQAKYANFDESNVDQVQSLTDDLKSIVTKIILTTIATLLLIYSALILEKALAINHWTKQKITKKLFLRLVWARTVWFLPWLAPIIIVLIPLISAQSAFQYDPSVFHIFVLTAYINMAFWVIISYYGIFFYNHFLHKRAIFQAMGRAFYQGSISILKILPRIAISAVVIAIFFLLTAFLDKISLSFVVTNLILLFYTITALRIFVFEKLL